MTNPQSGSIPIKLPTQILEDFLAEWSYGGNDDTCFPNALTALNEWVESERKEAYKKGYHAGWMLGERRGASTKNDYKMAKSRFARKQQALGKDGL